VTKVVGVFVRFRAPLHLYLLAIADIHHHGEVPAIWTLLRTNLSSASTYIVITSILGNLGAECC
jgi:hypothetical protein